MDKICAPSKNLSDNSCFDVKSLVQMATSFNKYYPKNTIEIIENKKHLVKELESRLSHKCNNQLCWIRQDFVKSLESNDINNETFRPGGPNKGSQWLSTSDIRNVIDQYHNKYPEFLFLGAVPMDFDELPLGIKDIDFAKYLKKGIHKIGIVFNTHPSTGPGEHWISFYTDLQKNQAYFFDSAMNWKKYETNNKLDCLIKNKVRKFINRVVKFMYLKKYNEKIELNEIYNYILKNYKSPKDSNTISNKIQQQITNLNTFDIQCNKKKHQFEGSECGVYSIYFIVNLVAGKSFDEVANVIKKDNLMNSCRKEFFTDSKI
jgi:hypothetical protein